MRNDAPSSSGITGTTSSNRSTGQDPIALLGAATAGAALMYFFDPQRGNRRQKRLRDRVVHGAHAGADFIGTARRDSVNRLHGIAAEARTALRDDAPEDELLAERVRAELGRLVSHPGAIEVDAANGLVRLTGYVFASEHETLIEEVEKVRGVETVEDLLEVRATADGIPALQGGGRRRERRFELAQTNWSPAARLITGAAGAALVSYGARQRGIVGAVSSLAGAALFARAATNLELDRILGVGGGRRAVDLQKAINVNAPLDEVFAFFTDWERWPQWMSHVKKVSVSGPYAARDGRTHWEVDGPAGATVSWDAEVTEFVPNKLVSWRSVDGSAIRQAGTLRFDQNPDGSVRVGIQMTYNPPGGAAGHAVAKLFGRDPRRQMEADLARLKTTIETGTPPHDAVSAP